jgi:hypothetical protein
MKPWLRWSILGFALVIVIFFLVRSYSSLSTERTAVEGETLTTPRSDIDFVFGGSRTQNNVGEDSSGDTAPSGQSAHYCSDESRDVETCEDLDEPVCGWFDLSRVECPDDDPCVRSVFPNECGACQNENIEYWTEGDCPIHTN